MGNTFIKFVLFLFLLALFGCKNTQKKSVKAVTNECNDEKSYPLGTDDISELSGMKIEIDNNWAGLLLYIFDCENGGFKVDRYLLGSGVAIAGKETFFCQTDGNTININDEEKLVLSDGRLHYFFKDEEFRIISVYSSFMESQIYLFDEIVEEK